MVLRYSTAAPILYRGSLLPDAPMVLLGPPPGNVGERTGRGARRPRCPHPATRLLPIGSLLAEGLWAADLCCTGFKVPGDLVVILRDATEQGFYIVLPRHLGQSPSMVRSLAVVRCAVHNLATPRSA